MTVERPRLAMVRFNKFSEPREQDSRRKFKPIGEVSGVIQHGLTDIQFSTEIGSVAQIP